MSFFTAWIGVAQGVEIGVPAAVINRGDFGGGEVLGEGGGRGDDDRGVTGPDALLAVKRERAAPEFLAVGLVEGDDPRLRAAGATDQLVAID